MNWATDAINVVPTKLSIEVLSVSYKGGGARMEREKGRVWTRQFLPCIKHKQAHQVKAQHRQHQA